MYDNEYSELYYYLFVDFKLVLKLSKRKGVFVYVQCYKNNYYIFVLSKREPLNFSTQL